MANPPTLSCRAAVLEHPGAPLSIERISIGPPRKGDVLVRIAASSLCHTDLEVIEGQLPYPMPIVLGHEAAGVVVEVGPGVPRSRIGEHVVLSWNPHCGHCFSCEAGQPILCTDYLREGPLGRQLDGQTRLARNGEPVATMFFTAGFAELAIVNEHCAVPIDRDMPFDRACLLGCAVMTGVGGAVHIGRVSAGETVLVIGCGAVGLAAVQGARLAGGERIIAIDPFPAKQALAIDLGATDAAGPEDAMDLVRSVTGGRGADVVIECAGRPAGFRLSTEACRAGGRVVWLGKVGADEDVGFRWGSLMGEKQLVRSSYGGARPKNDFPMLARAYLDGRLLLDELITARLALEDINSGFDALRRGESIRSVIVF